MRTILPVNQPALFQNLESRKILTRSPICKSPVIIFQGSYDAPRQEVGVMRIATEYSRLNSVGVMPRSAIPLLYFVM